MAWTQTGNIKGPKGDTGAQGERGERGPEGPAGIQGPIGPDGPQGERGPAGPKGEDGKGVEVAGQAATYADLPSGLTQADAGKAYIVEADGDLYVWSGAAFPADGNGVDFVGPEGPAGERGPAGPAGDQGERGPAGAQGEKGDPGPTGARGAMWFTGSGTPGQVDGAAAGDMYLDTASGVVYRLN